MADAGNLEVVVGAEVSGLLTGMQKAGKSLKDFADQAARFKEQLATATDPAAILRLNRALEASAAKMKMIQAAGTNAGSGFKKISEGSNTAAFALTNLGRVAQDAPFGFIGIANNINPLLESFQRLKAETGSTGSALKALVGSLAGAGGLGLAVSLGTAAMSIFGMMMQKSGKEAKEAAKTVDEYAKAVDAVASKTAEQVSQIDVLIKAYDRQNISQQERVSVIEKLKQISPEYFNQLSNEKTSVDQLTTAYNAYSEAVGKSIFADLKRGQLKTLLEKQIKTGLAIGAFEPGSAFDALFDAVPSEADKAIAKTKNIFRKNPFTKEDVKISGLTEEARKGFEEYNKLGLQIAKIEEDIARLSPIKSADVDKAVTHVETISDVLAKLGREIKGLNAEELVFGTDKSKDKISAIEGAIKELVVKFKVAPKDTIIQKLFGDIKELLPGMEHVFGKTIHIQTAAEILIDKEQAEKEAYDKLGKVPMKTKAQIEASINYSNATKQTQKFIIDMAAILSSAIETFASGIADAISGKGDLNDIFGNVFKVIGVGLQNMGKAMIEYGAGIIALQKAISNPYLAIAAGIGLVIIGKLMENSVAKFAMGVDNFAGGLAMVGERGPELVNLPKGSGVVPNHRLAGITGGGQQVMIPEIVLRGQDIVVILNRANRANARAF